MTLKRIIRNNLKIDELAIVAHALDIRPSVQRALVQYVFMDKKLGEIEETCGVSKTRLHYWLKIIRKDFIR